MRPEHLAAAEATTFDANRFLDAIATLISPVRVHFLWRPQLSDPEDEMVLEAAINGGADAIATFEHRTFAGAVKTFGIDVLTPGPLLAILRT